MNLLDLQKTDKSTSMINLISKDDLKSTISFADLLKAVKIGTPKSDDKTTIDNTKTKNEIVDLTTKNTFIDAIGLSTNTVETKDVQNDNLSSLLMLKNLPRTKDISIEDITTLNPQIMQNTDVKDLKILVNSAKNYLKEKILKSDGYKRAIAQELPKTLEGLKELSKVYGIDIKKITLEDIQIKPKNEIQTKLEKEEILKTVPLKTEPLKTKQSKTKLTNIEVLKDDIIKETPKKETPTAVLPKNEIQTKLEKEEIPKAVPLKTEPLKTKQSKTKLTNIEVPKDNIIKETPKKETPTAVLPKTELLKTDTQSIKLFSEPLDNTKTQHILQQVIHPKEVKTQAKETKQNTDDMLKSLLSDKSIISPDLTHKSMSSMPDVKQDVFKSLESLLQGDTKDETTNIKSDILNVNKADSFEVKLNEAKQMIRYISQDIKHSIDEYKSPFTRVKLQLNPQKLGDVELTIVQRGKNLHINLSSNNVAINSLALNSNELKVQLQNSGINNATLNFSNSSQSSDSSFSGGQQSFHHENKAKDEYNYFEKEEKNEEVISSLEIIVPHYA